MIDIYIVDSPDARAVHYHPGCPALQNAQHDVITERADRFESFVNTVHAGRLRSCGICIRIIEAEERAKQFEGEPVPDPGNPWPPSPPADPGSSTPASGTIPGPPPRKPGVDPYSRAAIPQRMPNDSWQHLPIPIAVIYLDRLDPPDQGIVWCAYREQTGYDELSYTCVTVRLDEGWWSVLHKEGVADPQKMYESRWREWRGITVANPDPAAAREAVLTHAKRTAALGQWCERNDLSRYIVYDILTSFGVPGLLGGGTPVEWYDSLATPIWPSRRIAHRDEDTSEQMEDETTRSMSVGQRGRPRRGRRLVYEYTGSLTSLRVYQNRVEVIRNGGLFQSETVVSIPIAEIRSIYVSEGSFFAFPELTITDKHGSIPCFFGRVGDLHNAVACLRSLTDAEIT